MEILPQLIINSLIAGSIYALLAMSFNLAYNTSKFFNFAHGSYAVVGAYLVFYLAKIQNLSIPLAVTLGIILAGIVGALTDRLVYFPMRKRKASGMVTLVASIGIFTLIQAIIAIVFSSQFQALSEATREAKIYHLTTSSVTQTQIFMILASVLILMALITALKYSLFGKAIKAIGDDEEVAKIVGINTNKIISYVFFLASAIAALAGILVGFDTGIEPVMGLNLFLKAVIAAIIGGLGSVSGGFLGGYFLGFVENFGIWKISGEWKDAIAFGLLIIFLLFRPSGIIKR